MDEPRGGGAPSLWALAAIAAAVAFFCPLATLLAPLLAVKALDDVRRHPQRSGRRVAILALVLGVAETALWIGGAVWWQANVRGVIQSGLERELQAAFAGDADAFRAGFTGAGAATPDAAVTDLVRALGERYGAPGRWIIDSGAAPREADLQAPIVPYVIDFRDARVNAEARFVVREPGRGWVRAFRWVRFDDPAGRPIVYPPGCEDEALGPLDEDDDAG